MEHIPSADSGTHAQTPSSPTVGRSLAIVDDCFPYPISSFRLAEFTGLLDAFPTAVVNTSGSVLPGLGCNLEISELIRAHVNVYPEDRDRIQPFRAGASLEGKAVYCVFLHNIHALLDRINRDRAPFVFTLYPGGGFLLDDPNSCEQLKRVFDSPNFGKVIVTQPITREYLLARKLCDDEWIRSIFGGVLPPADLSSLPEKQLYGVHKRTVDVCFAAWRYMAQGRDKGYDTFIAVARLLVQRFDFVHFHAVGPWSEIDVDVSSLRGRMHFHPPMSGDMKAFFRRMDLIVSPNVPFTLARGKFDGFPTGCCVEAGLSGTAVCASDELKQNGPFTNGRDILITSVAAADVAEVAGAAISDYDGLTELASRGQTTFSQVFGWAAQMGPRLAVLSQLQLLPKVPPVPAPRQVTR